MPSVPPALTGAVPPPSPAGKDKDLAESWTRKTTHTGDGVGYYEFDQRFEHPGRTWASATHKLSFYVAHTHIVEVTLESNQLKR